MRFFGTAAGSILALGIAGSIARGGGIRLASKAQDFARPVGPPRPGNEALAGRVDEGIRSFRKIERYLDELEGVTRTYRDGDETKLFERVGRRVSRSDSVVRTDGWNRRFENPELGPWLARDEIQQRMVRQARRLPYELPGFYGAQKLILDPVLGTNQDKEVNWANPMDVIGDFANESIKVLALNVMPFDAAVGGGKSAFRDLRMRLAKNPSNSPVVESARHSLEMLGANASDVLNSATRFSHQSVGAFSNVIQDAQDSGVSFVQFMRQAGNQSTHAKSKALGNSNFSRRMFRDAWGAIKGDDLRRSALDSLPGPFKGMGTAMQNYGQHYRRIGQTYDNWQDVVSGRRPIEAIRKNDIKQYHDLIGFMQKGGGTYIEQYAKSAHDLGGLGPLLADGRPNPHFRGSNFYNTRREQIYKQVFTDNLASKTGLRHEEAIQFVNKAQRITPYSSNRSENIAYGQNIAERIQFGVKPFYGKIDGPGGHQDWWSELVDTANKHNIPLSKSSGANNRQAFESAVRGADMHFGSAAFQSHMDRTISSQWRELYGNVIPKEAMGGLKNIGRSFENFTGTGLKDNADFMVRRNAQRLGIRTNDATGNAIPLHDIKQGLAAKGLNPDDLYQMRGLLMDSKDIAAPWKRDGYNLFGFKPLSVGQAADTGFYSANEAGVQENIKHFINKRVKDIENTSGLAGNDAWLLKTGGVFTHRNGSVVDLGRIGRGIRSFGDVLASETKLPIVGFNPAQVAGHHAFQAQRKSPAIKMVSAQSNQPFLRPGQESGDDFLLWMKQRGRGTKGKVVGVGTDEWGGVVSNEYEGLFRGMMTNAGSMVGRYGRIFTGEQGIPSSTQQDSRLKRLFDVSYDQDSSIIGNEQSWFRRWRLNRLERAKPGKEGLLNEKYRSAQRAAATVADDGFDPSSMTPQLNEGLENLHRLFKNMGYSSRVLKKISEDPKFSHIFDPLDGGQGLFDIPEAALPRVIKNVLEKDAATFRTLDKPQRDQARRLQQQLKNMLRQGDEQVDSWSLPVSQSARGTGVSRRIDQLRNEFSDYLMGSDPMRRQALGEDVGEGIDSTISNLFSKVESLFTSGGISRIERTEARAAILGLQVNQLRSKTYADLASEGEVSLFELNKRVASALSLGGKDVQETLTDIANFRTGTKGGIRGAITSAARRKTAVTPYSPPYEVNPIGDNLLLVPTYGTVADRSGGVKAFKGATASWSDPEAISGVSMVATHLSYRINRYMEMFGGGLDPTRYKGPLDFYARGIIGRRVAPAFAAGTAALAVDRTAGGMFNVDDEGNRVYRPLVLGVGADLLAEAQVATAALQPGVSMADKREQLMEGQVPVRQGRFWILGNTEWKGGRTQYFRPSWYQRFNAAPTYTPELNETPMERLLFNQDFSPLKPLDPYRRERQDYATRPYPVTGEYFTGPWGPLNAPLNATIGRVLKPSRLMHQEATASGLAEYRPVGHGGAYLGGGENVMAPSAQAARMQLSQSNQGYQAAAGGPRAPSSSTFYPAMGYTYPQGFASRSVRQRATDIAAMYADNAQDPNTSVSVWDTLAPYGVPVKQGRMSPRVISSQTPMQPGSLNYQARDFGYRFEEMAGIYGFGFASAREALNLGHADYTPDRSILEPASRGYSSARSFWNLNIGGFGDFPLPIESKYSNFELSEIVRRFIPKDPAGIDFINPIPNQMGAQYPWLPGGDYAPASIKMGDPFSQIPEAELRLPTAAYRRTNTLFPDEYGELGSANIHNILGNIAPWSPEYEQMNKLIGGAQHMPDLAQAQVQRTRAQVESMRMGQEFTPYEYKHMSLTEKLRNPVGYAMGRTKESIEHRDTYLNSKFLRTRTATEDWERENVYGQTFPQWQTPIDSFVKPYLHKSTQRNPVTAMSAGAAMGYLFGASTKAKSVGTILGAGVAGAASLYGAGYQAITGDRYIPKERKKQLALEEYFDVLEYTKSMVNASRAAQAGDAQMAQEFYQQSKQTMFGVDLDGTPEQVAMAVPSRKREHLRAMMYAPEQEQGRILSTAGRLERRILQAAWGLEVEAKPGLVEYFEDHELPPAQSEVWSPLVDMDNVKIKTGQHLGLDMAQMGYYPQQIKEANMINPAYPSMFDSSSSKSVLARLRNLLRLNGSNGDVVALPNAFGSDRVELMAGVF